ncbi:MAG: SatD family protein [Candidatus Sulfotelmatobacter sp.]
MARTSQRYLAVIADMVGSRGVPRSRRGALQKRFGDLIVRLNRDYRKAIAAKFVITLGDEFQGLLKSATVIPELISRLEDFSACELRVAIGLGTLDTPLQKYAINIDGPALHIARTAIEYAKKTKALGGVFRGFGDLDEILNGMARLLWFQRSQWTDSQRKIVSLLWQGMSQTEVARKLGIKKQVVSRQVLASGYSHYVAGDRAWRMILQKQVDPLLKAHGFFQRR